MIEVRQEVQETTPSGALKGSVKRALDNHRAAIIELQGLVAELLETLSAKVPVAPEAPAAPVEPEVEVEVEGQEGQDHE